MKTGGLYFENQSINTDLSLSQFPVEYSDLPR